MYLKGTPNTFFFLENPLKRTTEYFLKFLDLLKVQSFRLILEGNFVQMAASAGHVVAYTIDSIFSTLSIVCSGISPMA